MTEKHIDLRNPYGSSKDKALDPETRQEIFKNLKDEKNRAIFILGSYAGMRVDEIKQCRFEWLEKKYINEKEILAINIPEETRHIDNKYKIWRPKTKRGRTTYLFDKELYTEIWLFFKYNDNIGLAYRSIQDRAYLITGGKREKGKMVGGVSIHSLRATAQNYLFYELGLNINAVATILGHRDIRTTYQHYVTLNKAQVESYLTQEIGNKSAGSE